MWIMWLTMIWLKGPIFIMFWNCSYMSRRVNWPEWKEWKYIHRWWRDGCEEQSEGTVQECGCNGVREWDVQECGCDGVRECRSATYHASTCQSTPHFHPTSVHWLSTLTPRCLPYLQRTQQVKLLLKLMTMMIASENIRSLILTPQCLPCLYSRT